MNEWWVGGWVLTVGVALFNECLDEGDDFLHVFAHLLGEEGGWVGGWEEGGLDG